MRTGVVAVFMCVFLAVSCQAWSLRGRWSDDAEELFNKFIDKAKQEAIQRSEDALGKDKFDQIKAAYERSGKPLEFSI